MSSRAFLDTEFERGLLFYHLSIRIYVPYLIYAYLPPMLFPSNRSAANAMSFYFEHGHVPTSTVETKDLEEGVSYFIIHPYTYVHSYKSI